MTLQSSGNPISINDLVGEYGGSAPHSLSEYYKGGSYVANHSNNANVPTSSTISLSDFYGQSNTSPTPTQHNYNMTGASVGTLTIGAGISGASNGHGAFGSISPNPQTVGAFASGWNPTILEFSGTTVKSNTTLILEISGSHANSGWTSLAIAPSLNSSGSGQTLTRATANHVLSGGNQRWTWNTGFTFVSGASATFGIYA
tara:strand:+ start:354 stop:956 length:603 start_codon:yes stop_codon:yes gene_type:complete